MNDLKTFVYYYSDPNMVGLVSTEDMVVMMDEMGIDTCTFPRQRPYGLRSTILRRWDGNRANTWHGALSSHGC